MLPPVGTLAETILAAMLLLGDEKHVGCDVTTDERCPAMAVFRPQGKPLEPIGLGTLVAQLL